MPRVSICIPAYKSEYFEACLRSAIGQSYGDTEILVSDDCPNEDIKNICDKFPGLINYSRNPNPGLESNVLRLIYLARGEYVKYLFDDDILHPFCVQFLLSMLEKTRKSNTKLAFSPRYTIDKNNNLLRLIDYAKAIEEKRVKIIKGDEFIRFSAIKQRNAVGEFTTALFRREDAFHDDGRFRLFPMEGNLSPILTDMSAWIELAKIGSLAVFPFPLSYFRRHPTATSNPDMSPNFIITITSWEDILNMAISEGYLPPETLPEAYRNLVANYRTWISRFPQLQDRIERLEGTAAVLAAQ